jgi:hypothetical protein
MKQLKHQVSQGDIPKVKMVAKQMAHFRNISDRNFARSLFIQSEAVIRKSNHTLNQAHMGFLKGMRFANWGETIESVRKREKKYHQMQDMQQSIEEICNLLFM